MGKRVPVFELTRQRIREVMEGRIGEWDRSESVRLAAELIIEEALEAEVTEVLGRGYYENGAPKGGGYRNGYRPGKLKTAEGLVRFAAPQVSDGEEPHRSRIKDHLKGQTEELEKVAEEECFVRSARQRCLAHRMRNLAGKVPEDVWPEFRERVRASYQAPSREIARMLREEVVKTYQRDLPTVVRCFEDDFEACTAHLRFPVNHRQAIRTTNRLKRLFVSPGSETPILHLPAKRRLDQSSFDTGGYFSFVPWSR